MFLHSSVQAKYKTQRVDNCQSIFFSELGYAPAILNSEEEWKFIKKGKMGAGELDSYWIGGSTDKDTSAGSGFYYHQYLITATGRHMGFSSFDFKIRII